MQILYKYTVYNIGKITICLKSVNRVLYFILVSDKILYTKTFTVGIICFMTEHFV